MRRLQGGLLALCWPRLGAGSPQLESPLCHWASGLEKASSGGGRRSWDCGEHSKESEPHCVGGEDVCVLFFWLEPHSSLFSVWRNVFSHTVLQTLC